MARFVTAYNQRPTDGANSCGVGHCENSLEDMKATLDPRDQELLTFLETAKPGDYIESNGRIIFRNS